MAQRGPQAHAEGWDAAMLLSFRSILVSILPCLSIDIQIQATAQTLTCILQGHGEHVFLRRRKLFSYQSRMERRCSGQWTRACETSLDHSRAYNGYDR